MIEYALLYFILCLSSVGLGKLYIYLIQPGRLFQFMQHVLVELKNESQFLYKSLGGCDVCTRQRFTDLSYVILLVISPSVFSNHHYITIGLLHLIMYCFYGGLAFYFESIITIQHTQSQPPTKTTNIEI